MGKRYTNEEKEMILKEVSIVKNRRAVAAKYKINESTIRNWENKGKDNLIDLSNGFNKQMEKENNMLKKIVAEKELEIQILKDMLKKM